MKALSSIWQRQGESPATKAALVLLLVWCAAQAQWWLNGMTVPWDAKNQIYPMIRFLASSLHEHGVWPLWNPYHYAGHPTVADPQSLLFNPTLVWMAVVSKAPFMAFFDTVVAAHLLLGAWGVVACLHKRSFSMSAMVLAGVVFMLGGSASGRLQHTMMIVSYGLTPWALFALERLLQQGKMRHALVFGLIGGIIALGRDQVCFLLGWSLVIMAVAGLMANTSARQSYLQRVGLLLVSAVIAVSLLAIPALLSLDFLATSNRPDISLGTAWQGSLAPLNLATMVASNIYGSLTPHYFGPGPDTVPAGDWTDRTINYLYMGLFPFVLLFFWRWRTMDWLGRTALILMVTWFLFALGRHTPVFGWLYSLLPGASLYRRPADASFAFLFFASIITAYAYRSLERREGTLRRLAAALLFGLVFVVLALVFVHRTGGQTTLAWQSTAIAAVGLVLVGVVLWLHRHQRMHNAAFLLPMLVTATLAELSWKQAANPLNAEPASRYHAFAQLSLPEQKALHIISSVAAERDTYRPRTEILGNGGPWQNAPMAHGLEALTGYNALRIKEFENLTGLAQNSADPNMREFPMSFRGYESTLARLLGVEFLMLDRDISDLPPHIPRPDAEEVMAGPQLWLYRLRTPLPRVMLATRAVLLPNFTLAEDEDVPDFDWQREALIQAGQPLENVPQRNLGEEKGEPSEANPDVQILHYSPNEVRVRAATEDPALLVLHDLFYPGWVVRVNGQEKPLIKTNYLFRGVEIPAGEHLVTFSFEPLRGRNLTRIVRTLVHKERSTP